MKTLYKSFFLVGTLLVLSCDNDEPVSEPYIPESNTPDAVYTSGSADFSNFVSVGNSLTAGYSDSGLFAKGQAVSFPNILNEQFKLAGGTDFKQPLMADDTGGFLVGGNVADANRLIFDAATAGLSRASGTPTTEMTTVLSGPFNNMGVPGAKTYHLVAPGYGSAANLAVGAANPYFVRMASAPDATVIGDAVAQSPTFFSLWIGNNDVLGYASQGGNGVDHNATMNMDPSTYGANDITFAPVFESVYSQLVAALTANGAKGVICSVVDVKNAPYFKTVPHNPVPLDAQTAAVLNSAQAYGAYNAGIQQAFAYLVANTPMTQEMADAEIAKRTISFSAGEGNAVVILDEDLTDLTAINPALVSMRQATADDMVVLPAMSFIGTLADPSDPLSVNGVAVPLADQWVLTPEEQASIDSATALFNMSIKNIADANNIPYIDVNTLLTEINEGGKVVAGTTITADFVTGGAFSLDGIHPSPRGYALVANEIIRTINASYGSNLPTVREIDYTGVYLD